MTDIQQQVLIGSVLGGSSLIKQPKGKNYYLTMRSQDSLWLRYKIAELYNYFMSAELSQYGKTYCCNTVCSSEFTLYREKLYKNNKRFASEKILDRINDLGLAIWFIEGGGWAGRDRKNAYINTTMLSSSSDVIWNYFKNILDFDCSLHVSKNRQRLLFGVRSSQKLMSIILPKYPDFLIQRLTHSTLLNHD